MKAVIVLVLSIVVPLTLLAVINIRINQEFKQKCEKRGGEVIQHYGAQKCIDKACSSK